MGCAESAQLGRARRIEDAAGRYIEFCKSTFPNELDLRGLKIALDCANGAVSQTAPEIFSRLGIPHRTYNASPDGMNINDGCGSTVPEFLAEKIVSALRSIC